MPRALGFAPARRWRYIRRVTTPIRPLPEGIGRWMARLRWLRWGDALLGWLVLLLGLSLLFPGMPSQAAMALAAGLLLAGALSLRVRVGWRPLSGTTTFVVSRRLRAGDHAWFVHGSDADLVLVTARHGLRLVIARPGHDAAEGLSVRRTRVLLLPASVAR
jgi:hypothetical protein